MSEASVSEVRVRFGVIWALWWLHARMVQAICDTGAVVSAARPHTATEEGNLRIVVGRLMCSA